MRARRAPWLFCALLSALPACRAARAEDSEPPTQAAASASRRAGGEAALEGAGSPLDAGPAAPQRGEVEPLARDAAVVRREARGADAGVASPRAPCPPEMTLAAKTCVDRWEAILVERSDSGEERVHAYAERPEKDVRYEARSRPGVFPQAYVNRLEASAACKAAGKRLCSLGEWYRACRGKRGTTFPYGWNKKRSACNVERPHLLGRLFGNDPQRWDYVKHFNSPELNRTPGGLAKTAAHEECVSDYGAFDMVGNLHEWVTDMVDDSLPRKLPLRDDLRGRIPVNWGHGIFMGGFYSTSNEHGDGCGFVTIGHEPKYHDYSTGFRCCKDPAE